MLRNIFFKTLRDYSRQVWIWGGCLFLLMLVYGTSYNSVFGPNVPNRAKVIEDYTKGVQSFTILTGKVYDVDSFGSFVNVKLGSMMPLIFGLWALLAFSAIIRGEEERGNLDLLSSTPHSRISVFFQKAAALTTALLGMAFLSWFGMMLAVMISQADLSVADGIMAHLNWAIQGLFFGLLALLLSQVTSRKAAAGWAGGLMAGTFLLNNMVDTIEALQWSKYLYPFYYGSLSQPLIKSVGVNWGGLTVLVFCLVPLAALALWMYLQRDHNSYFMLVKSGKKEEAHPARTVPEPQASWLANNFTFGLRDSISGVLIWGLGLSAYMLLIMSVFNDVKNNFQDMLTGNDFFKQLGITDMSTNENLLSVFIFLYMVLLVAAYAVILVSSWTSEENEGRLELVLSNPIPRWRLLLSYFGVAAVSSALMIGLMGIVFWLCTIIFNIPVNPGHGFGAFFGMWIVSLIIEAVGYILAAFGPGWAVGVTGGLVILSYFSDLLKDVLKIPEAITNLSVFHQYGRPMVDGLQWLPQILMVILSVFFIAGAVTRFRQRDITK